MAQHPKAHPKSSTPAPTSHREVEKASHEDDLVVVPVGQNRVQFFLILGLMIFVLVIFTVGPFFQQVVGGAFSGSGAAPSHLQWVHPETGEEFDVDFNQFKQRYMGLRSLSYLNLYVPEAMRDGTEARSRDVSDQEVAMFMILDRLAEDAGVAVTTSDMRQRVEALFGSLDNYRNYLRQNQVSPVAVEADLKRLMRAERYAGFLKSTLSVPDPRRIEELWSEANVQHSLDYVQVAAEDYHEQARNQIPADEELHAWLRAQPEAVRRPYLSDDTYRVEVAYLPVESDFDAGPLLEKYPLPEDWDLTVEAENYYNQVSHARFLNEEPPPAEEEAEQESESAGEEGPGEEGDEGGQDGETMEGGEEENSEQPPEDEPDEAETAEEEPFERYQPFEEVREVCEREAPLKWALDLWLADLNERALAGEPVDFAAETAAFGLSFREAGEPKSRVELEAEQEWAGPFSVGMLVFAPTGRFASRVTVENDTMVLGRQMSKVSGLLPPIEEIRDLVSQDWLENHAADLALAALEEVYASFEIPAAQNGDEAGDDSGVVDGKEEAGDSNESGEGEEGEELAEATDEPEQPQKQEEPALPTVDSETFERVMTEAGFSVVHRPWLSQYDVPDGDLENISEADQLLRSSPDLFTLEEGQVGPAKINSQRTHTFLFRYGGKRPSPIEEMKPADLQRLRAQASRELVEDFEKRYLRASSPDAQKRFGIELYDPEDAALVEPEADAQ